MALIAEREAMAEGWFIAGKDPEDYDIGTDQKIFHSGSQSGYIRHKVDSPRSFATLMQIFKAGVYHGKRIKMTAFVKAEKIEHGAGLWLRVDGPRQTMFQFDNMSDRPIKGTSDWKQYEIVLDVPPESVFIAFGVLLQGKGRVWADDFVFTEVDKLTPTTDPSRNEKPFFDKPINLSF